jgi:hypothetical protein
MPDYVRIDRRRLFPKEADAGLPLQAKLFARMSMGPVSSDDLRSLIAAGAIPALDDPDAVNETYAQGW